jgi:hypothetical protein
MYCAGIGSRKVEDRYWSAMAHLGYVLAEHGIVVRQGKAEGSDQAFLYGLHLYHKQTGKGKDLGQSILPWANWSPHIDSTWDIYVTDDEMIRRAAVLAAKVHPVWHKLTHDHKMFHIRNMFQVFGPELCAEDMSEFILFCAPEIDGIVQGGTASAVHMARRVNIPTINLRTSTPKKLQEFLRGWNINYDYRDRRDKMFGRVYEFS